MKIVKRIVGALFLPAAMFVIMYIACQAAGKTYFGTWTMWRTLIPSIAASMTSAMGIGIQFKNGRFDFSGGAIMLLAAIIAGRLAQAGGNSPVIFAVMCIVLCVVLSVGTSLLYVYGRLPIVIATIGIALLYESITPLIYGGAGVNLGATASLSQFSRFPLAIFPLVGAFAVYAVYSYLTVIGKQSRLLSNNQSAAVNIGINEPKNVIITYVFSGLIFGFATMLYASSGILKASYSSLSTVGSLFSNILPVFIGLMLARFCGDTIGTLLGSVTLCLMSFGLQAIFSAEMGSAITLVITGAFVLVINTVSSQGDAWIAAIKKSFTRPKAVE